MKRSVKTAAAALFLGVYALLGLLLAGSLVPQWFGYQVRIVESGSMAPTIPVGAAIVVSPADTYDVADVVTFERREDARATTHRIVEQTENGYLTKGDANDAVDTEPVEREEIAGVVRFHVPWLGFALAAARSPLGFVVLVGVPAVFILVEQVRNVRREIRAQKQREDEREK